EINAAYKKLNGRKLKKSIYIHGLFYDYKTDRAVFMMQEDRETNEPPDNGHIVIYEMTAEKFRMIKLGDEFRSTYMTGTWDGIVYVSNWETGIVYGLKF
ncbi:MAG: hypothetical protein FWG92_06155, partial [Leptospirales bacterium]|nr:hypothetical protein [Leptospirales bacterium]